jgi:hypothetical protein
MEINEVTRDIREKKRRRREFRTWLWLKVSFVLAIAIPAIIAVFVAFKANDPVVNALQLNTIGGGRIEAAQAVVENMFVKYASQMCSTGVQTYCYTGGSESIRWITGTGAHAYAENGNFTHAELPEPPSELGTGTIEFNLWVEAYVFQTTVMYPKVFSQGCRPEFKTDEDCTLFLGVAASVFTPDGPLKEHLGLAFEHHPIFQKFDVDETIPVWQNCQGIGAVLLEIDSGVRNFERTFDSEAFWNAIGCPLRFPKWDEPGACEALAAHWQSRSGSFTCPLH